MLRKLDRALQLTSLMSADIWWWISRHCRLIAIRSGHVEQEPLPESSGVPRLSHPHHRVQNKRCCGDSIRCLPACRIPEPLHSTSARMTGLDV